MFIRTERLFLRPAWAEDARELARAIAHHDVVRMLANAPWPYGEGDAEAWIAKVKDPRFPTLLVTSPADGGRIVGSVGISGDRGTAPEAGYWIAPDRWGRGYATEALGGLLTLARTLGHRRIFGRHAVDNPASGRVLRKAGFRPTGRNRPCVSLSRGVTVDAPEYALELGGRDGPQDAPMPKAA